MRMPQPAAGPAVPGDHITDATRESVTATAPMADFSLANGTDHGSPHGSVTDDSLVADAVMTESERLGGVRVTLAEEFLVLIMNLYFCCELL